MAARSALPLTRDALAQLASGSVEHVCGQFRDLRLFSLTDTAVRKVHSTQQSLVPEPSPAAASATDTVQRPSDLILSTNLQLADALRRSRAARKPSQPNLAVLELQRRAQREPPSIKAPPRAAQQLSRSATATRVELACPATQPNQQPCSSSLRFVNNTQESSRDLKRVASSSHAAPGLSQALSALTAASRAAQATSQQPHVSRRWSVDPGAETRTPPAGVPPDPADLDQARPYDGHISQAQRPEHTVADLAPDFLTQTPQILPLQLQSSYMDLDAAASGAVVTRGHRRAPHVQDDLEALRALLDDVGWLSPDDPSESARRLCTLVHSVAQAPDLHECAAALEAHRLVQNIASSAPSLHAHALRNSAEYRAGVLALIGAAVQACASAHIRAMQALTNSSTRAVPPTEDALSEIRARALLNVDCADPYLQASAHDAVWHAVSRKLDRLHDSASRADNEGGPVDSISNEVVSREYLGLLALLAEPTDSARIFSNEAELAHAREVDAVSRLLASLPKLASALGTASTLRAARLLCASLASVQPDSPGVHDAAAESVAQLRQQRDALHRELALVIIDHVADHAAGDLQSFSELKFLMYHLARVRWAPTSAPHTDALLDAAMRLPGRCRRTLYRMLCTLAPCMDSDLVPFELQRDPFAVMARSALPAMDESHAAVDESRAAADALEALAALRARPSDAHLSALVAAAIGDDLQAADDVLAVQVSHVVTTASSLADLGSAPNATLRDALRRSLDARNLCASNCVAFMHIIWSASYSALVGGNEWRELAQKYVRQACEALTEACMAGSDGVLWDERPERTRHCVVRVAAAFRLLQDGAHNSFDCFNVVRKKVLGAARAQQRRHRDARFSDAFANSPTGHRHELVHDVLADIVAACPGAEVQQNVLVLDETVLVDFLVKQGARWVAVQVDDADRFVLLPDGRMRFTGATVMSYAVLRQHGISPVSIPACQAWRECVAAVEHDTAEAFLQSDQCKAYVKSAFVRHGLVFEEHFEAASVLPPCAVATGCDAQVACSLEEFL